MFIVTLVFLVATIFTVHQILLQYSYVDMPASFQQTDYHLMKSVEDVVTRSVTSTGDCDQAKKNLGEIFLFFGGQTVGGYSVVLDYSVNCTYWENSPPDEPGPVNAKITLTSEKTETTNRIVIYNIGSVPCSCTDWADQECGLAGCAEDEMQKTRVCSPPGCDTESQCTLDIANCLTIECRLTGYDEDCLYSEVDVLGISSPSNAHAELWNQDNYPYSVCCSPGDMLGRLCAGGTEFLKLSDQTNAHVQDPSIGGTYPETACLSTTAPGKSVSCQFAGSSCPEGTKCIVSTSWNDNAHVASCSGPGAYDMKVCCGFV